MSEQSETFVIAEEGVSLSVAWARALLAAVNPRRDLIPLVIQVSQFSNGQPCEDPVIRRLVDQKLMRLGKQSCHTVANTIFPQSLRDSKEDRRVLYERYKKILPRLKAVESRNNRGLYFERLIAYDEEKANGYNNGNQLEHIIETYRNKTHRRSALQAAIFDPRRDHRKGPFLKFPCLQHVTFVPCGGRRIAVNGFYAMQYLFERAYGNYLGLCRLGEFVAHEIDLELIQMNCTVGIGTLDVKSSDIKDLIKALEKRLAEIQ
jgi:hypothetical protein